MLLVQGGCALQVYDVKNPDEYHSYWEEHRKDSILYPYTGEYREETEGKNIP
jgi:hypothetical protein